MRSTRPLIGLAALSIAAACAHAHDGGPGEHLNIGYYYGHDGSFESPASPPWAPTLLVDTHPWELGDVLFELRSVSNALLDGWETSLPGFDALPVADQEFDGHGFYSWLDPSYGHGTPAVMLHIESMDEGLAVLSPFTLQPLPVTSFLGTNFHTHAIFYVERSVGLEPGDVLTATFRVSDANGRLSDSEPFTLRFGIPAEACAADRDGDGAVGVSDLLAYLGAYRSGAEDADTDGSGTVDVSDLLAYLGAYRAGC